MEKAVFRRVGATVFQGVTASGLRYVICPVKKAPTITCAIAVGKGGFRDEETIDGTRIPLGTAHFLEHRLFDMKEGNAAALLSDLRCNSNAFTTSASTTYYFTCLKEAEWKKGLDILARMVSTFHQTDEAVDRERQIILREREGDLNSSDYQLMDELRKAMYFSDVLKEDLIGTPESLETIHVSALKKFFLRHYSIGNMFAIITGDVDPVEAAAKLEKLKMYNGFTPLDATKAVIAEDRTKVVKREVEVPSIDGQTYLGVGIKFPSRESLFNKYGDLLFALYKVIPPLLFSCYAKPIDQARQDGLLIFSKDRDIVQNGEDTFAVAGFETNAPRKLKAVLDKHLANPVAGLSVFGAEMKAAKLSSLAADVSDIADSESYMGDMVDGFENHIAWPALASRAATIGSRDIMTFLRDLSTWPRSYVVLRGEKKA